MVAASEISEPATTNLNISAIAGGGTGGGRALPYVTVCLGKVRYRAIEVSAQGGEYGVDNAAAVCHRLMAVFLVLLWQEGVGVLFVAMSILCV